MIDDLDVLVHGCSFLYSCFYYISYRCKYIWGFIVLTCRAYFFCRLRRQKREKEFFGDTPNPGKGLRPLHSCLFVELHIPSCLVFHPGKGLRPLYSWFSCFPPRPGKGLC